MAQTLIWANGEVRLQPLGAMIDGLRIKLADGRFVEPLAIAPWADEPKNQSLPNILLGMRGEWPCVPFGTEEPLSLPSRWPSTLGVSVPAHGYGSNEVWDVKNQDNALLASISYPSDSPIEGLRRIVRPMPNGIAIELAVTAREDCRIPIV